jgi:ATP-dependent helicase/nuclease subunit A
MSKLHPLKGEQRQAVSPARSVWLSASAGTGKTQVLSSRVLRLLLQTGVEPDQILCLTFTKAGAAEMATRVNDVLARWVRVDDAALAKDLGAIGAAIGPDTLERARSRFAAVLDCPGGGLRIGTIHGFAQWLLSVFPIEAGLRPGTRAMEDRDRDLLMRQVLADVLIEGERQGDGALLEALSALSLRMGQRDIEGFLMRCAEARGLWEGPGAWQPPLRPRINQVLGLAADEDGSGLADLVSDAVFDVAAVRRCMTMNLAWGTKTGIDTASILTDWLEASPKARLAGFEDFALCFMRKDGLPRSATNIEKKQPGYAEYQARVIACVELVSERQALVALAARLDPALTLGRRFALAWTAAKEREGFIDFDDQIRAAAALLTEQASAEWIRYKLDRRFDHILVDEAQDTNAEQWRIVLDGLVQEFFTGEGQRGDVLRTLFVVGDYKQAIFRFQGTSPENFDAARVRVKHQLREVAAVLDEPERALLDLGLGQSYRSAATVLEFVDAAIAAIGPERFGLREVPGLHEGDSTRPGVVGLWQPVGLVDAQSASDDDDEPEAVSGEDSADPGEVWLSRRDRALADQIAQQVKAWLTDGLALHKGGLRRAGAGDVMVLVRRRKELAGLIVARLHAAGVPVAGVDRLRLGAPLGVKDLVAALRFCAQPWDDLNLAGLLVSPLIGWSQEDLLAHGYREKGVKLWEHLRSHEGPLTHETMEQLRALLARADFEPPAALLHWLLVGPWQGRRKLAQRLGAEVNDPIDELLNAALGYASAHTPSLAGFLQWFDAGEGELKREAGRSEGLVRVMTVHGAKGLQAPIVILADAADNPDLSPPRGLELIEDVLGTQRKVPLPALRKAEKAGPVRAAEEAVKREEREEHWRLLYVAMTRAEEALFITGALGQGKSELPPDSWFAQLAPLFDAVNPVKVEPWGQVRQLGDLGKAPPSVIAEVGPEPANAALPACYVHAIGPEPRPPRPLAPSSLGEEDAADPPVRPGPGAAVAAQRGTLMHKLLERLPELAPQEREAAALAWLEIAASGFDPEERGAMVSAVLAVLYEPEWQDVFGADSLAEVPIAALVGERIVSGTIDRLLIGPEVIRIVDFKTGRRPPRELAQVPAPYLRQMAAYAQALAVIYPGRRVEAALLYTHAPKLFVLPDDVLAAHKLEMQPAQESLSP